MQEYYWARLSHRAQSQSVTKTTNKFKSVLIQLLMVADVEWTIYKNERQRSVNEFMSCKYGNSIVNSWLLGITDVLAAFMGKTDNNAVTAPFWE